LSYWSSTLSIYISVLDFWIFSSSSYVSKLKPPKLNVGEAGEFLPSLPPIFGVPTETGANFISPEISKSLLFFWRDKAPSLTPIGELFKLKSGLILIWSGDSEKLLSYSYLKVPLKFAKKSYFSLSKTAF